MKTLLNKLFKKETPFNYILSEYQPLREHVLKTRTKMSEYDLTELEHDEMEIDNIYQKN